MVAQRRLSWWVFKALIAYDLTPDFIFSLTEKQLKLYIIDALYYQRTGIRCLDNADSFGGEVLTALEGIK